MPIKAAPKCKASPAGGSKTISPAGEQRVKPKGHWVLTILAPVLAAAAGALATYLLQRPLDRINSEDEILKEIAKPDSREAGIMMLASRGKEAFPLIEMLLGHEDPDYRGAAVEAAVRIGTGTDSRRSLLRELLKWARKPSAPGVRRGAYEALIELRQFSEDEQQQILDTLRAQFSAPALQEPDGAAAQTACRLTAMLDAIDATDALDVLLAVAGEHGASDARQQALINVPVVLKRCAGRLGRERAQHIGRVLDRARNSGSEDEKRLASDIAERYRSVLP